MAASIGVNGILVSNHGARQVDGTPASVSTLNKARYTFYVGIVKFFVKIEALPEVVEAVQGKLEVYLDGGIREGTDVFKALALGAKMVNTLHNIHSNICTYNTFNFLLERETFLFRFLWAVQLSGA